LLESFNRGGFAFVPGAEHSKNCQNAIDL